MTNAVSIAQLGANNSSFTNRIINGAMVIDQRNAGASYTVPSGNNYVLDRYYASASVASKFTIQQSTTTATGYKNSMLATSSSAYTVGAGEAFGMRQAVEGLNVFDLAWGTANAATVTLSFWVRSSLTGTFGGSIFNSAADRSYPFSYTISAANTFEQKTITITGDTSGTWLTTNGIGLVVSFSIGTGSTFSNTAGAWYAGTYLAPTGATSVVGTNGATFYITGVQLEKGSTATSFDYRPYGTELALCQRYFEKSYDLSATPGTATTNGQSYWVAPASLGRLSISFQTKKRTVPTIILYSPGTGASGNVRDVTVGADVATSAGNTGEQATLSIYSSTASREYSQHWTASAEL